jgi:hypothetical protein
MAALITRTEKATVSHHYVAKPRRYNGLKPHRQGAFTISKGPAFAENVADIVGFYLCPPGRAVVLSRDEKQILALGCTQPLLPIAFYATEKPTHDYMRHGTTNLLAALNVATREIMASARSLGMSIGLMAFLKKALKPYAGKEAHVVLDDLSAHTALDVQARLADNPSVTFHFAPTGSSWVKQTETRFRITTRQAIRRGTFTSVKVLVTQARDYIPNWNTTQNHSRGSRQLIDNNDK